VIDQYWAHSRVSRKLTQLLRVRDLWLFELADVVAFSTRFYVGFGRGIELPDFCHIGPLSGGGVFGQQAAWKRRSFFSTTHKESAVQYWPNERADNVGRS
jgi:hypothetical protein